MTWVVQCECMDKPSRFETKTGDLSAEAFVRRHHAFTGHHTQIHQEGAGDGC